MKKFDADDLVASVKKDSKKIIEAKEIELTCDCGHKLKERVGRLKKNPKLSCSACGGVTFNVNTDELLKIIDSLGRC